MENENKEIKQETENQATAEKKEKKRVRTRKRKITLITALSLAATLFLCIVLAAIAVLPQFREKGTRYEQTKSFNNGDVKMIAHRGLSGLALENSLKAFALAGQADYYGIEADVHVTKDGKFIITHDDTTERITGTALTVEETTFDELRSMRFKDVYGSGEELYYFPTLEEYIAICKQFDKQAILEIKNLMPEQTAQAVAKAVEATGWLERTTFISFAADNLLSIRKLYPNVQAQYLVQYVDSEDIDFMIKNRLDGSFAWISITPSRVRRMHKAGLNVGCWTVDGRLMAWWMKACGVDFITSNILE